MTAIRPATAEDFAAIEPLWTKLYRAQVEQGMVLRLPERAYDDWVLALRPHLGRFACLFVAEEKDVSGFLAGRMRPLPRHLGGETAGYISEVFVRETLRGQGTGKRLVDAAILWFEERSVTRVELNVAVRNTRGKRFYERLGFVEDQSQMVLTRPRSP
ncbi:MAG TPA: GNAT family N-acetyltransferase [Planctomycetota bacterium]|nr:GNAT family N-acetyltransferase [Planctomycetota bacterium]